MNIPIPSTFMLHMSFVLEGAQQLGQLHAIRKNTARVRIKKLLSAYLFTSKTLVGYPFIVSSFGASVP
jgi:hypothetical protein